MNYKDYLKKLNKEIKPFFEIKESWTEAQPSIIIVNGSPVGTEKGIIRTFALLSSRSNGGVIAEVNFFVKDAEDEQYESEVGNEYLYFLIKTGYSAFSKAITLQP